MGCQPVSIPIRNSRNDLSTIIEEAIRSHTYLLHSTTLGIYYYFFPPQMCADTIIFGSRVKGYARLENNNKRGDGDGLFSTRARPLYCCLWKLGQTNIIMTIASAAAGWVFFFLTVVEFNTRRCLHNDRSSEVYQNNDPILNATGTNSYSYV